MNWRTTLSVLQNNELIKVLQMTRIRSSLYQEEYRQLMCEIESRPVAISVGGFFLLTKDYVVAVGRGRQCHVVNTGLPVIRTSNVEIAPNDPRITTVCANMLTIAAFVSNFPDSSHSQGTAILDRDVHEE